MGGVKLLGFWASPYVKRVELALKVKGIPYESLEQDLFHPSDLLLQYNPVYKAVPVLVHKGKPVAQSLTILEYIDETWNQAPKLLPEDPYERATVRFWADYIYKLFVTMASILVADDEAQKKILEDIHEKLRVLEEVGIPKIFHEGRLPEFHCGNLGLLEIEIFTVLPGYKAVEGALGVKLLDPHKIPRVYSWITALNDLPIVKEVVPPHDKMVIFFKTLKKMGITIPAS